jgi:hypothetical protein
VRIGFCAEEVGGTLAEHFTGGVLLDMRLHADDNVIHFGF